MELFKIVSMNASDQVTCSLFDGIDKKLAGIDVSPNYLSLEVQRFPSYTLIMGIWGQSDVVDKEQLIFEQLSQSVADYIVDEQESHFIRHMIRNHPYLQNRQDEDRVFQYAMHNLLSVSQSSSSHPWQTFNRRLHIMDKTKEYFQENRTLNLEGYILFRLKHYVDEIALIVEQAMDDYRLEQHYQEFITLLKYFVYIQDAKISLVHVIHTSGHEFEIIDNELQAIHFAKKDSFCKLDMIDHHVNVDDMLISTLVSLSPGHIFIHSHNPFTPVIQLIKQIFEDRVHLCSTCHTCQTFRGEVNP